MAIDKKVYTAHATSTGGRVGTSRTPDGKLELTLSTPKEMGGDGGPGTNPEQLFAAGYSACFVGAIKAVAGKKKIKVPDDISIAAAVSFGPLTGKPGAYGIGVDLKVTIPGMEPGEAQQLVAAAHEVCPYSNATRGNVEVDISVA